MEQWEEFLKKQAEEFGNDTINKWVRTLKIKRFDACNLYLEAKDSFQALWFEEHIRPKISSFINNNARPIKVHLTTVGSIKRKKSLVPASAPTEQSTTITFDFEQFDASLALENFIINEENSIPHTFLSGLITRLANYKLSTHGFITNTSHDHVCPIYLTGPSGCGKTHLLMATAQKLRRSGFKVVYAKIDTFTEHLVRAIKTGEMAKFRAVYRDADVLFLDDVDHLKRKTATQEELFHTFNTLHLGKKLIFLASCFHPQNLQGVEPRLVSRFEWGIVLPLVHASKKELIKVIEKKAEVLNSILPKRIYEFLAETFSTNAKHAIQALQTILLRTHLSSSSIQPSTLTVPYIKELLSDLLEIEHNRSITFEKIITTVSSHWGIPYDDIVGKSQSRECVIPRQVAMYLCRKLLKTPYMKIGDFFSRDHSTVMSAIKQIERQKNAVKSDLAATIVSLETALIKKE